MAYQKATLDKNNFFHLNSGQSDYVGYQPKAYNEATAMPLLVWMHGCGGEAEGDVWSIKSEKYISISIGGRDGDCWQTGTDNAKVLSAMTDIQKYYNIDKNKIFLSGYSSGGDMTYRVGFENANLFAGLLVENSSPFRDTGSTATALMGKASWKINIAHLAHTSDTTYPIAQVKASIATLQNNKFPVTLIEKSGTHWDDDKGTTGTNYDLVHFLLPYIDAGWTLNNSGTTTPPVVSKPTPNVKVSSIKNKAPGDQGYTSTKTIVDGYDVPAGTYSITAATRVTYSDDSTVVVDIVMYGNQSGYDFTWEELTIDMRGATVGSFWDCTVSGKTDLVIVKPTTSTKTILSNNKNGFGFTFTRPMDSTKSHYQVLIKSIKW